VQDQTDPAAALGPGQGGHDLFGARHLGHVFGMDEADGLDPPRPRRLQPLHQVSTERGFQHRLFVLKAVARADFDDLDKAAHRAGSSAELSARSLGAYTVKATSSPLE